MTTEENPEMTDNNESYSIQQIEDLSDEFIQQLIDNNIEESSDDPASEFFMTHSRREAHDLMRALSFIWLNLTERYANAFRQFLGEACNEPTRTTTIFWGRPSVPIQPRMRAPKLQEQYWTIAIIALVVSMIINFIQLLIWLS